MATNRKGKGKSLSEGNDPNVLRVTAVKGASREAASAKLAYDPAARSLAGARWYIKGIMGEQALTESLEVLREQIKEVQAGSLEGAERTLVAQANTLDAIFNELARRAALNMNEYLNATETYLRLALKAQSQCRATLETLAEIKNPMAGAYVRQANIAAGHQQVNNGTSPAEVSRARETETASNKLLEATDGERLDFGAPGTAGAFNSPVEALGAVHRAEDEKRES